MNWENQCPDEWESEDLHNEDSEYDVFNLDTKESTKTQPHKQYDTKTKKEIMFEILKRSRGR